MPKTLRTLLVLLLLLGLTSPALAGPTIVIVQSSAIQPYEEAKQGFVDFLAGTTPISGQKCIQFAGVTLHVLSDNPDQNDLLDKINAESPDLILAIGTNALVAVKGIAKVPIIYLMVPYPAALVQDNANIGGVDMEIDPTMQLRGFTNAIPALKHLGLLYDPLKTGDLAKKSAMAAQAMDITLVAGQASNAKDVPRLLEDMVGKIDAFWMLPDTTVITPQSVEYLLLFSLEHRIPILTFSDKYLKRGAMAAVTLDTKSMGRQAGEMARDILGSPNRKANMPREATKNYKVLINHKVADVFGIPVGPDSKAE